MENYCWSIIILWRARCTVLQLTCHVWITYSVKLKDHDLLCFTELANTHRAKCCRYQQAKGVQQDWSNAGPAFATLSQHWTSLVWTFLVCWDTTPQSKEDYLSALPIRRTVEWICLGNSSWISKTFMHLNMILRDNWWSQIIPHVYSMSLMWFKKLQYEINFHSSRSLINFHTAHYSRLYHPIFISWWDSRVFVNNFFCHIMFYDVQREYIYLQWSPWWRMQIEGR